MAKVKAGDEDAYGQLLERYWAPLVRYAVTFNMELEAGEDLVQEAFVRLWQYRGRWKPRGSVRSYMYSIVRNLALQEQEKRNVRRRWQIQAVEEIRKSPTPDDRLGERLTQELVRDAIQALPPRRREILILARFHGFSHSEIAEAMSISTQTVANQISAALRGIKVSLSTALGDPTDNS